MVESARTNMPIGSVTSYGTGVGYNPFASKQKEISQNIAKEGRDIPNVIMGRSSFFREAQYPTTAPKLEKEELTKDELLAQSDKYYYDPNTNTIKAKDVTYHKTWNYKTGRSDYSTYNPEIFYLDPEGNIVKHEVYKTYTPYSSDKREEYDVMLSQKELFDKFGLKTELEQFSKYEKEGKSTKRERPYESLLQKWDNDYLQGLRTTNIQTREREDIPYISQDKIEKMTSINGSFTKEGDKFIYTPDYGPKISTTSPTASVLTNAGFLSIDPNQWQMKNLNPVVNSVNTFMGMTPLDRKISNTKINNEIAKNVWLSGGFVAPPPRQVQQPMSYLDDMNKQLPTGNQNLFSSSKKKTDNQMVSFVNMKSQKTDLDYFNKLEPFMKNSNKKSYMDFQ